MVSHQPPVYMNGGPVAREESMHSLESIQVPEEFMLVTDEFFGEYLSSIGIPSGVLAEAGQTEANRATAEITSTQVEDPVLPCRKRLKKDLDLASTALSFMQENSTLQEEVDRPDQISGLSAGAENDSLAPRRRSQPEAQRRYRERQKNRVRQLEDEVDRLTSKINRLEQEKEQLSEKDPNSMELQLPHCYLQTWGKRIRIDPALRSKTFVELEELHYQRIDKIAALIEANASDEELNAAMTLAAEACQLATRAAPAHLKLGTSFMPSRMVRLESIADCVTHGQKVEEARVHWDMVLDKVTLSAEQLERVENWRLDFLDAMEEPYTTRQSLISSLIAPGIRSNSSVCKIDAQQETIAKLVASLHENLQEQQRTLGRMLRMFVTSVLGSVRDTAALFVASGQAGHHLDPLAFANAAFLRSKKRRSQLRLDYKAPGGKL